MAVALISSIDRYIGASADVKPTGVRVGSTFYETDTLTSYVTADGTNWIAGTPLGTTAGLFYTPDLSVVRKTVTFTGAAGAGAAGAVALFTITGRVLVTEIVPYCTTSLTESGGTATLALGVTGSTALFIAATGATGIDEDEFWVDTSPDAAGIAVPAALKGVAIAADIIATVADADIDAGVISFEVYYRPLSTDGALVAS